MKKVIVIVGPTASGKSNLGIKIAKAIKGEIISGDSVQIYQDLNIGSAKMKKEDMEGIPHYLIDILKPGEPYSVAAFQHMVREKINTVHTPIIVGGTGLYIQAAIADYEFDGHQRNPEFERNFHHLSNQALHEKLSETDLAAANTIHPNNRKRVLRALEIAQDTHQSITKRNKKNQLLYDTLILYLDVDRELLRHRIDQRVNAMIKEGLATEAKKLYDQAILIDAIGYKEWWPYFEGQQSFDDVVAMIKQNTKRLAKKQATWFKNQTDAKILSVNEGSQDVLYEEALEIVEHFLGGEKI